MPLYGKIVVIKRDGTDGTHFPLTASLCLFGRKKECDIRIQLPQVSKEHCKIEVNENKEATLFNLSSTTPTQLNGINIQDPTYLKHGDVLTIIDRSFRFEYPPLSSPRKRLSRSQVKETLQVLHVQQEEQELLHSQDPENGNPQISEKQNDGRSQTNCYEKKRTTEYPTGQYGISASPYKIYHSERKNEISPFSKLYELMKYEGSAENTAENAKFSQQKKYSLPKYGNFVPQAAIQAQDRRSIADQNNSEAGIWNGVSHSGDDRNQGMISSPLFAHGYSSRRSSGRLSTNLQNCATKQKGGEDANQLNISNTEENELEKSKDMNSNDNTVFRATRRSAKSFFQPCSIVALDSSDTPRCLKKAEQTEKADADIKAKMTDTAECDENALLIPKSKRESFQSCSSPNTRHSRSSSKFRLKQVQLDFLIEMKSSPGTSSENQENSGHICAEEHECENLIENKDSKTMESKTVLTTEPVQALRKTEMDISANSVLQNVNSKTIASLHPNNQNRISRMCTEQDEEFSNRNYYTNNITPEELLVTPADPSGTGKITPVQLFDPSFDRQCPQEEDSIKQPTAKCHDLNVDEKSNVPVSSNPSESGHENSMETSTEAIPESIKESPLITKPEIKKSSRKRKGPEHDLLTHSLVKRKRVSFGGHLSPELFDKRLPPNSPLKRGAIPARLSLPFGNSPRAVLKKTSGLRQSVSKEERKKILMQMDRNSLACGSLEVPGRGRSPAASPPTRRSPAISPPAYRSPAHKSPAASPQAHKSPAASPMARRSPATSPLTRRSTAASPPARRSKAAVSPLAASPPAHRSPAASPPARRSKAASPPADFCNIPQKKGRFSVSPVTWPSSELQDPISTQIHLSEGLDELKIAESTDPLSKAASSLRRSKKFAPRRSSLHRRSTADAIHSKRRSGASEANLIVAKSWADIVKQGVPKSQIKTPRKKRDGKRYPKKIHQKPPKNNVAVLKTPIKKVKGHFTTGHANSPAPILIGKAHSKIMNLASQPPKVILYPLKQQYDLNESFTGMAEMFKTPLKIEQEHCLSSGKKTTPGISSEIHSPGKSEEASTTAFCISNQQSQAIESPLSEVSQVSSLGQGDLQVTPRETSSSWEVSVRKNSPLIAVYETAAVEDENPEQNSELSEGLSAVKRILRSPRHKQEAVKVSSGIKRILTTPKQKMEPVEMLSGIKRILRTPKQKTEPVEALSGVKRIFRTPKQKAKFVEALSGVKRILRTPKQKTEPVEALSGIKRIFRTPKQKIEPVEALSGVKRILRTPKQKLEPVEALSGVKRLLTTPKEVTDPIEVFSGIKRLLRTPEENLDPVVEDICSKVIKSPEVLIGSCRKKHKQVIDGEIPKKKVVLLQDLEGVEKQLGTANESYEPVDDLVGVSQLFKTPRQKFLPVDDYLGLQKLMAETKQRCLSPEIDYTGIKEMLATVDEPKDELLKSNITEEEMLTSENKEEENRSCINSRNKLEPLENESERQEVKLETSYETQFSFKIQRIDEKCDAKSEVNPLNELKKDATETKCLPESCQPDGIESPNADKNDFVTKTAACLSPKDKGTTEPLALGRRTRKQKTDESGTLQQTRQVQKRAMNSHRAKSNNYVKNNHNVKQNVTESSAYESQVPVIDNMTKIAFSEECRKLSVERNDTVQDFGKPVVGNICTRSTRGKAMPLKTETEILKTAINENKDGSTKCTLSQTYTFEELENKTQVKENAARRGKRKKVCFLHEKNNSLFLEDKCVLGTNSGIPKEKKSAFSESSMSSAEENTSQKNKRKVSVVSQVCFPVLEEKPIVEMCGDKDKKGIMLSFENITLTKDDPSVVGSSFFQIKNIQERQIKESPKETQTFPLESIQTSAIHSPLKRQDVAKESLPRRGRSRKTLCPEICTEYAIKQSANMKKQNMAASSEENQPKRSRRKRIDPVLKIPLPVEDIIPAKCPQTDSSNSAQRECSLQLIQKEENPNETPKEALENVLTCIKCHSTRRQKVEKENPPRRGRSKQAISHESSTKSDNQKATGGIDCNTAVTIKETEQKRFGRKRVVPAFREDTVTQKDLLTSSSNSAKGKILQHIQNEDALNDKQEMPAELVQTPTEQSPPRRQEAAKQYLPRRGRRKQIVSDETSTTYDNKEANEVIDSNMGAAINENRQKRGRRKRVEPTPQEDTLTKKDPITRSSSSAKADVMQHIHNEDVSYVNQKVSSKVVETSAEKGLPRQQKEAKEYFSRSRRKNVMCHQTATECERKQAAELVDRDIVVAIEETKPKQGKGNRVVPAFQRLGLREDTAFSKSDSFNSAQGKCSLQQIQNEASASEDQEIAIERIASPTECSPPKRLKMANKDPPRRGRRKAAVQDLLTECERKQAALTKYENIAVKNADSTKKNGSKKGRERKISPVSQECFSSLQKESLTLSPSIKSSVEPPNGSVEIQSRRGRRKKTDDTSAADSAPASKTSKLLDKNKEEKVPKDLQALKEENVSKRGRRKQLVPETSAASSIQPGNNENVTSINDKTVHVGKGFEKKNQSKSNREKQSAPASEPLPSLKVSISIPSSSENTGTANESLSTLTENVRKGRQGKYGRNNKIMESTTSVKTKNKPTEEISQEKDLENKTLANTKECRRGRKNVNAFESIVSVSPKEKDGIISSSGVSSEDQQKVLDNASSSNEAVSYSMRQKYKGKIKPKDTDQSNTEQNDQNSDSEISAQVGEKNSYQMRRRKQVKNDSGTSLATVGTAGSSTAEHKSTKSKKEKDESTALKKGKKMKEDDSTVVTEPAAETEGRTRSKRTRKRIL